MTLADDGNTASKNAIEHWVSVTGPDGVTNMYPLDTPRLVIGRAPECEIVLNNDAISRHHAEIIRDPFGRWLIHDLGSRNGLKVNNSRVNECALLPQVKVRLDRHVIQYTQRSPIGGTPRDKSPVPATDTAEVQITKLGEEAETRLAAAHLFALLELSRKLVAEEDPDARRQMLCQLLIDPPFQARGAMLLRLDRRVDPPAIDLLGRVHTAGSAKAQHLHMSRRLLARVAKTGETLMASNTTGGAAEMALSVSSSVLRMSAVAAPVRQDSQTMDVLYVVLPGDSGTHEWLALAGLVAEHYQHAEEQLALSRRAQTYSLIEQDLARARDIQKRLLPSPLSVTGLDVAWHYEPCRWVGGDYVDAMMLTDGRVFMGVGDVCGKGMQAALISSSVHTLLRSLLPAGLPLKTLMHRASEHLSRYLPAGAFVTMLAVILNPSTGACEIVNAGHPELQWLNAGGKMDALEGGINMPLGLLEAEPVEQHMKLEKGDAILLFTDGWPDLASPAGEQLGEERFVATVRKSFSRFPDKTAQSRIDQINGAVETFRNSAIPSDDRTLLMACWNGV